MTLPAYAMNLSSFPEMYEHWLVEPLFRPWAEVLLERAALSPESRVIDIASGTGIVARLAKQRVGDQGRVVGIDISPQMLSVGKAIAPNIDWREGDAAALPVGDDERFDAVLCQQGLQFFPDKPAAAREMRRVMAPGGKLVVSVWRPLDEIPFFNDLHRVAERHLGTVVDQRYGFGDTEALESLLSAADFHDVRVETVSRTIRFEDPAVFLRMNAIALVGMSSASRTRSDEERAQLVSAIVGESAEVPLRYANDGMIAFEIRSNVATARG